MYFFPSSRFFHSGKKKCLCGELYIEHFLWRVGAAYSAAYGVVSIILLRVNA